MSYTRIRAVSPTVAARRDAYRPRPEAAQSPIRPGKTGGEATVLDATFHAFAR
ncbi:hypothetical protein [Acuticoccus sediminis]|uniref:hypothetical protein n=1 Tax=Acuticoccus sediminis TaxID=2184697 RepID=UPI001CFEE6ED|nr:hypothetical protein [Acuticoccus sediminis]